MFLLWITKNCKKIVFPAGYFLFCSMAEFHGLVLRHTSAILKVKTTHGHIEQNNKITTTKNKHVSNCSLHEESDIVAN